MKIGEVFAVRESLKDPRWLETKVKWNYYLVTFTPGDVCVIEAKLVTVTMHKKAAPGLPRMRGNYRERLLFNCYYLEGVGSQWKPKGTPIGCLG